MPQQLNITAGPSKFELMLALFDNTSTQEITDLIQYQAEKHHIEKFGR